MSKSELLTADKIRAAIAPQNIAYLSQLEIFDTIDSTNTYLLAQAKAGAPSGTVCFAEQQTQGRGRLARTWVSPPGGNLYCSLLWRFENVTHTLSSLSVAVAVIIANVLRKYSKLSDIQLKWPNDVLIAQRKLAGILLEQTGKSSIVIGIGLNVQLPPSAEKTWISLADVVQQPIERNQLAGLILNELFEQLPQFAEQGLRPFMRDWRQHDVLMNQTVTVHTPEKNISGVMCGINELGELLLRNDAGAMQQFCYGEVSVRFL